MPTPPVTCNAPVFVDVAFVTVVTYNGTLNVPCTSSNVKPVTHVTFPAPGDADLNSCLVLVKFCR